MKVDSGTRRYNIGVRPIQMLSYKEKIAYNYEWWRHCVEYYGNNTRTELVNNIMENYQWYNSNINEAVFHKVLNPYNSDNEKYKNFPANIRPFNIIRKLVDLFIGEYRGRGFSYQVNVHNPDAHNKMLEAYENKVSQLLRDVFVNELSKQGADTTSEPRELEEEEISMLSKGYDENYKDERAIEGQYALDYITQSLNIEHKLAEAMLHWIISGAVVSYKNVKREEIVYEAVNVADVCYDDSVKFIEDGEFCSRVMYMSVSEVIDRYYDELKPEEIKKLEEKGGNRASDAYYDLRIGRDNYRPFDNAKISVLHSTWKSLRKIGILTTINEFGLEEKIEVDESYKLDDFDKQQGSTIEWLWVNEVLEGTRIDTDIFVEMRPVPCQRNEMNNYSACKLPYNGRHFSNVNSTNTSIVSLAKPYAILYIITFYAFELNLAKNKGRSVMIDMSQVPKGWELEKFMYYSEALGYNFIDTTQPNASRTFNQYSVLDMSTLSHCLELMQVAEMIKNDMFDSLGISPQRLANVSQSSGKGITDRAVFQSSVISEQTFALFDEFVQRELQGLLDCSKLAWINGKKAMFIGNDQRTAILEIDPENYVSYDFGVMASNRRKDSDILEVMREVIQPMAQNGASAVTILNILEARNISKLKEYLEIVENKNQKLAQQQQKSEYEQQQQLQEMQLEMTNAIEKLKSDLKIREMEVQHGFDMEIETLKGQYKSLQGAGIDSDANGIPDILEVERLNLETQIANTDKQDKDRAYQLEKRKQDVDAQLKLLEIESKMSIEKLKAKTALKNKTTGEK